MNVLVTGGQGMVGFSIQKLIQMKPNEKYKFVFLSRKQCDLCDKEAVYKIFTKYKPEVVIHLASHVGGVYDNIENNYTYLMDNILINCNIVDACKEFGVKKLINTLSTCIFPDKGVEYPLTSNQLHNGLGHESNLGYSYSKRVLHIASKLLTETSDIIVVNLIPTNLYGLYDNYNIVKGHFIPAIVHKAFLAKETNTVLKVKGNGEAVRQFLYADDLACIILQFLEHQGLEKFNDVIVSPPPTHEQSIRNVVKTIVDIIDFKGDIVYDSTVTNGQIKKTTQSDEVLAYFPDFTFTPLEKGLEKVIGFFERNHSSLRK